ncbi:MAG: phage tail sheath C-terminal domain-containing protein [Limnobacter sp.]|uniref:phage tail sheath C-terminal domain-containing protein n=1 Tax=Limnobacter sp. TaxID=2003368 RepID=UPI003919F115
MSISFNQIPVNLLTPGQYVEFDNSRAVTGLVNIEQRILVIAPQLATGTAPVNVPFQLDNLANGTTKLGRGSIGADMIESILKVTDTIETWVLPIADLPAGVQATGTIVVSGAPTEAGTINLYVAGTRVQVPVSTTDTATTIATAIAAAINANGDLPVTAGSSAGTVTVTSRHKGTLGNDIDMRVNYYPLSEKTPAGVNLTVAANLTGGTGDPSIATGLAAIGQTQYNTIVMAFNDDTNLAAIELELDNRWGPLFQNDGHCHIGFRGTVGQINTKLSTRNNSHLTMWTVESGGEPQPIWEKAALGGAIASFYLGIDPARPLQTLAMPGRLPASMEKRFTRAERNNILSFGGATTVVNAGGNVVVERAVTTYTQNAGGFVDPSYRDIETMYTLSLLRYQVRARISQKFPRYKLANDGTQFAPGQAVVTPKIIKAELIALFRDWEEVGLVEDVEQFKADLLVNRNNADANRVDVLLPPNIINQFRVFASQIQFRL